MAKIRDSQVKQTSGGYERLFGIPALGRLVSRLQSTVISSGSELERMVIKRVTLIPDLDEFLMANIMPDGVYIAPKKQVKNCTTLKFPEGEPDFLVFKRRDGTQECFVVELKDGHLFDTKKAMAERRAIHSFVERNAQYLQFRVRCYFCCFNQDDRDAIVKGFKGKISKNEAITGKEFCELLELDYDEIVNARKADQSDNFHFFMDELVKIPEIRSVLKKLLKDGNG